MTLAVGIDDLNLYATSLSIDNAVVAAARGLDRYVDVVGIRRRSVAPPFEDPVTLAVNAAKPLLDDGVAGEIELLIVATESGFDLGKPMSSYVHRHLGLPSRCRHFEAKHACYAGTLGLQLAAAWIQSGARPGKKALVVTTDLAGWYHGQPAELTPGTGAAALLVSAEPRVLALDPDSGYATKEVYDTARPTPTTHWVDEVLSLSAYLDLLEEAWAEYRSRRDGIAVARHFTRLAFHTPLVSLVRKAHQVMLEAEDPDVSDDTVRASFERLVVPSLRYCEETGNIFSGTLYAALAALVDAEPLAAGSRIGLYSYGSGSGAELFSGLVAASAQRTVARHEIARRIAARRALPLEEYEWLMGSREESACSPNLVPERDRPRGLFEDLYRGKGLLVLERIKDHYRHYAWS
jgi:3-hydroxy-3-methylglutaryl CoA synthase